MTAITSRKWSRPPSVYDVSMPKSHITAKTTMIVRSMAEPLPRFLLAFLPQHNSCLYLCFPVVILLILSSLQAIADTWRD